MGAMRSHSFSMINKIDSIEIKLVIMVELGLGTVVSAVEAIRNAFCLLPDARRHSRGKY